MQETTRAAPYPSIEAFRKASLRLRDRLRFRGDKMRQAFAGIVKFSSEKGKKSFADKGIRCFSPSKSRTSPSRAIREKILSTKQKRDIKTLGFRKNLAAALEGEVEKGEGKVDRRGGEAERKG